MFKMMVTPWHHAIPYLGIGTYYVATEAEAAPQEELIDVTLAAPLILNGRQVRMLVQKYGTDSPDAMTAYSGAWTLRREILQMGHDGIIAVGSSLHEGKLALVMLGRLRDNPPPPSPDKPGANKTGPTKTGWTHSAEISRLEFTTLRSSKSMKRDPVPAGAD